MRPLESRPRRANGARSEQVTGASNAGHALRKRQGKPGAARPKARRRWRFFQVRLRSRATAARRDPSGGPPARREHQEQYAHARSRCHRPTSHDQRMKKAGFPGPKRRIAPPQAECPPKHRLNYTSRAPDVAQSLQNPSRYSSALSRFAAPPLGSFRQKDHKAEDSGRAPRITRPHTAREPRTEA